jgi:hypothetical protein
VEGKTPKLLNGKKPPKAREFASLRVLTSQSYAPKKPLLHAEGRPQEAENRLSQGD